MAEDYITSGLAAEASVGNPNIGNPLDMLGTPFEVQEVSPNKRVWVGPMMIHEVSEFSVGTQALLLQLYRRSISPSFIYRGAEELLLQDIGDFVDSQEFAVKPSNPVGAVVDFYKSDPQTYNALLELK